MPKNDTTTADLTAEIYGILDQRTIRPLDGQLFLDVADLSKGAINGAVRSAHDQSEIAKFSIAVVVS